MLHSNPPSPFYQTLPSRQRTTPWGLLIGATVLAFLSGAVAGLFGGLAALIITLFLVFAMFAVGDYRFGVMLALFILPLSGTRLMPHELGGIRGLNPLNVLLAISFFSLLMTRPFMRKRLVLPTPPREVWLFLGIILFGGLLGATNVSKIPGFYQTETLQLGFDSPFAYLRDVVIRPLLYLIFAYMLSLVVANARKPERVLIPYFISSLILPIIVMVVVAVSGVSLSMLASSHARNFLSRLGLHANELGLFFNMTFALGAFTWLSLRSLLARWLLAIALGLVGLGVLLTFSRGALLGMAVIVLYFLFTARRFSLMAGMLVLMMVVAAALPSAVVERASMGFRSGNVGEISAGRVDHIWLPLLPETVTSPLVGHGMSSILWSEAARRHAILPVGHPHSAYLGVVLDFGLMGVIVVFMFYRHLWRYFSRLAEGHDNPVWRGYFRGALACILLLLVQGLTDDRFTPTFPQCGMWLAYGVAMGLNARAAASQPKTAAAVPAPHQP